MKLRIEAIPPSLNKLSRMHWAVQRRLTKQWTLLTWKAMLLAGVVKGTANGKVRCVVTIRHSKLYDKDNAYGGCKPLIDSLKMNGLIVDDSAKHLELTVEQEKCSRKESHTEIELTGL